MKKTGLMKTAIIRLMAAAILVLGAMFLPGSVLSVRAEDTQLPSAESGIITLTEDVTLSSDWTVNDNLTLNTNGFTLKMVNNTITIPEDVTLTVSGTISVESGKTLTVNGQGTLIVTGANGNNGTGSGSGIKGSEAIDGSGTLVVDGANVTATGGNGGSGGEGSDGGYGGYGISSKVTVKSGSLTVRGGNGGAGGNGNSYGGQGGHGITGDVTVEGGSLIVIGGDGGNSALWNGGSGGNGVGLGRFGASLTVESGTVSVTGGHGGNGLGSAGSGGIGIVMHVNKTKSFIVKGGNVSVTGGICGSRTDGADNNVSCGSGCVNGSITVEGGTVKINGGSIENPDDKSGVGGKGVNGSNVSAIGGSLTITGGKDRNSVYANGVHEGNITLKNGTFKVSGGNSVVDGKVTIDEGAIYKDDGTPVSYYTGELPSDGITAINGKTLSPANDIYTVGIADSIKNGTLQVTNGAYTTISTSPVAVTRKDATVTLTATPETGYQLDTVTVRATSDANRTVAVSPTDNVNIRTFTMPTDPAYDVTASATFTKAPVDTSYVDYKGASHTVQAIPLDNTMTTLGKPGTGGGIWYLVKENITFDEGITFNYDETAPSLEERFSTVNLILQDGCTMSVGTEDEPINGGCVFEEHAVLNVYGQESGTGELAVFGNGEDNAIDLRMLTIYGGKLIAKTADNTAIYVRGGDLSIHGGNVSVTAEKAAAVGFPEINGTISGTVLVQGGEFTAESSSEGSGYYTVDGGVIFGKGSLNIEGPGVGGDVTLSYDNPGDSVSISKAAGKVTVANDKTFTNEACNALYASGELNDDRKNEIAGKTLYPACQVEVKIVDENYGEVAEGSRHGSLTASQNIFKLGNLTGGDQTVILTINPDEGYMLAPDTGYNISGLQITGGPQCATITPTKVDNTTYTFTMPAENVLVRGFFVNQWEALQKVMALGGTVTLDRDYTAPEGAGPLDVPADKTVTLDLAGHTIDRGLTSGTARENGCVIMVGKGGNLTIEDSGTGSSGKITGGNNSGNGGGVYVAKGDPGLNRMGGSLTMLGGQITGNKAAAGGGVYVEQGDQEGYSGSMSISGKPVITGNTLTDQTTKSNVGLSSGTPITVTGALTGTGKIGVTPSGYEKFAAGGGSYVIAGTDLAKFGKDSAGTAVAVKDTDGKAYFAERELTDSMVSTIPDQTWTGSAIEPAVTVTDGSTVLTKDTHYTVSYSSNTEPGTATATVTGIYNSSARSYYGSVSRSFTIEKATPVITALPRAADITYGESLQKSSFSGGTVKGVDGKTLNGSFSWDNGSEYPKVSDSNTTEYLVNFIPHDTSHYNTVKCKVTLTVRKKPVTITGLSVSDKPYDGSTAGTSDMGAAVINGLKSGDEVTIAAGSAVFEDADAGKDKKVRFSGYSLSGKDADNYSLQAQPEAVTAQITPKVVSLSWTETEFTYDGYEHCPTATAGELISGDSCSVVVTGGQINVNASSETYTATASSLTNGNYTLPEVKTTGFSIAKADATAPAAITKSYLYSRGGSDSFTLTGLPADCGAVTWGVPTTTGSLVYSEGPSVNTAGVLSYTVGSGDADTGGTITAAAETENYKDITFTVNVNLADKTPVKLKSGTSVTLESSTLSYGQALSELSFHTAVFVTDDEDAQTVEGTLAWKEPDTKPAAGTPGAVWVFTPTDASSYASFEGIAAITVEKALPVITASPAASSITYGKTLGDSTLTGGTVKVGETQIEGTFTWKNPSARPDVADSGSGNYEVVFTPSDHNYAAVSGSVTLTVEKAGIPTSSIMAPTARTGLIYTASAQALVYEGAVSGGTMYYAVTDSTITTAPEFDGTSESSDRKWSVSIPRATDAGTYYVWYKVIGDTNHKDTDPKKLEAGISKASKGSATAMTVEVQMGTGISASVNVKGFVGENAAIVGIPTTNTNTTGSLTFGDIFSLSADKSTLTFNASSENGGTGIIIVTLSSDNYENFVLTIPVEAKAKTTEVKLEAPEDGAGTSVRAVEVSGLSDYTEAQEGTSVQTVLDVNPVKDSSVNNDVKTKIDNLVGDIYAAISTSETKTEYLEIRITKKVDGGNVEPVPDLGRVIEMAVYTDLQGKNNPVVIREHKHNNTEVVFTVFKELTGRPAESDFTDGTCFVDWDHNVIYIYSEYFSTYSLVYATTETCKLTFDPQDGSPVNPIVVSKGGCITELPSSSRSGYTLDGWFTEKSGGSKLTSETVINSDITYYAQWTPNSSGGGTGGGGTGGGGGGGTPVTVTCTVRFDMNGKTVADAPATQSVAQGGTAVRPAKDPEAEGFTFDGWYREAACENLFDFSTPITADTVIYAKWIEKKAETFTVTFDLNGKPGTAPAAQTVEKDGCAKEPAAPETEGFTFTGWFTEVACSTKYDFATPVTADLTLYAGWEAKTEPGPGPGPEPEPEPEPVVVEDDAAWNLYEDASEHEYQILGINATETVANSNVKSKAYYDAKITGSTITVKVTGDRKKAALAANTILEFDLGSAGVVEYALPVCYVKPVFKLSSTSATIKSGKETTLKTTVLVKCADGNFAPYDMTDVQVSGTGLGTVTKGEDGSIEIKTSAAGRGKIGIVKDTWDGAKAVNLAYTVKGSQKDVLSVDLQGLKTVVLNSNAKGQSFGYDVMFNGASVSSSDLLPIIDKKNTGLATISDDGKLVIAYKDGIKNGTYTVTLQSKESKEAKTNVKIRVNGKKLDKAITTRILRKYDVVTKQSMVVVPNLKDVGGRIETVSVAEEGFTAKLNAAGNIEIDYIGDTNDTESSNTSEKNDVESAGTDAANAVGNAIINEKYNVKNLNIGTLTLSLTITGIDDPVTLPLKNVRAKKTTPTAKVGIVTIPAGVNPVEGQVIGTANIVSTYKVNSGVFRTIKPVKAEIIGTPKGVTAKPNENDPAEIDIYSISKKNASLRVKLTYAGGVTKTVTVRVKKK